MTEKTQTFFISIVALFVVVSVLTYPSRVQTAYTGPSIISTSVIGDEMISATTSSQNSLVLPPFNLQSGEVLFVNTGVSNADSSSTSVISISPNLEFMSYGGTTRRTESWAKQVTVNQEVTPVIQMTSSVSRLIAQAGRIGGLAGGYTYQAGPSGQVKTNSLSVNVTTSEPNSLIMLVLYKSNAESFSSVDGTLHITTAPAAPLSTITKEAAVPGVYAIGASWAPSILSSYTVIIITPDEALPPPVFQAENTRSHKLAQ